MSTDGVSSRLARRLGTLDAIVIGLGSMIGAGVFAAFGPAARAAGNALLIGLAIAGLVAYCNATSSAELAALYPESGGAYVYGRKRLGAFWGFLAGWAFVIGKLSSVSAMAMTFASYAAPSLERPVAVVAVMLVTAIDYFGLQKTALVTRAIVVVVLGVLVLAVSAIAFGGSAEFRRVWPLEPATAYGVLQSAGFMFFAFAGYARIATLGEEVKDPERTIPHAVVIALGIVFFVYALVAVSALCGAGAASLAASSAPLATAVELGRFAWLSPVVRVGAAVASFGVLLSLVLGVSRTVFAMSANRDLPALFSEVHPRYRVPHRAELAVGAAAAGITMVGDLRSSIGVSSVMVLVYYAVANAAAWTLERQQRRWPRALAGVGFVGCLTLAGTLPPASIAVGAGLLVSGALVRQLREQRP